MAHQTGFSRLEASLTHAPVAPRPMSNSADHVYRHAKATDLDVDELDFDFNVTSSSVFGDRCGSLQDIFSVVQWQKHFSNEKNFSAIGTQLECLTVDGEVQGWQSLDETGLYDLLEDATSDQVRTQPRLLLFFIPRIPMKDGTSYGSRTTISQSGVETLFARLQIDPAHLMNLLGRPDYWAPQALCSNSNDGDYSSYELSLQHPRWNLQVQGSPLSVYMKHDRSMKTSTYLISHKLGDTSIAALRKLIDASLLGSLQSTPKTSPLLNDPLEFHTMLAMISFEASKHHVKRFQRFMWEQFNKVDDHFDGKEMKERSRLDLLTKELQVISLNADSHLANAAVATANALSIKLAHRRVHNSPQTILNESTTIRDSVRFNPPAKDRTLDAIDYLIASLEKQRMWFLNYKNRKDNTMGLVYNLVTQQDAANNIGIAIEMRKDSSSMNAIAALTMFFLPGTFTATTLGAGLFSAVARGHLGVQVSSIWWLWLIITVPLTTGVMVAWYFYSKYKIAGPPSVSQKVATTGVLDPSPTLVGGGKGRFGRLAGKGLRRHKPAKKVGIGGEGGGGGGDVEMQGKA